MQHDDVILTLACHRLTCSQCGVDVRLHFFFLFHGMVWVCEIELSEIELSHMGKKNNQNPDLVCEKTCISLAGTCSIFLYNVLLQ